MNQNLFYKRKRTPKQFANKLINKEQLNKRERKQPVILQLEITFLEDSTLKETQNQIIETWNVINYGKFN